MKLLAISLARLTVLMPTVEVNPRNSVSIPDFTRAIVEHYGLLKFPKTVEEYDLSKGVTFGLGKLNDINIENILLYHRGVVIETRSSTKDCESVLQDLATWAQQLFGVEYAPVGEPRKFFLSELSFHTNIKLLSYNPALTAIASRISKIVSAGAHQPLDFETTGITLLTDLEKTRFAPSSFRIERLADTPFEEGKYFSSAPLQTHDHMEILGEFEKTLTSD